MYRKFNRPVNLLLVEDNPADVELMQFGFEEAHAEYRLRVAIDGEEALQLLHTIQDSKSTERPDLILLDLRLPKVSGHEVLRHIKGHRELRAIPVIVLTSSRAPVDVWQAYDYGANSYLQKPESLEHMIDLMRSLEHYWLNLALLPTPA